MEELQLPQVIHSFAEERRGLILVTGATGSGKSTTLASIIEKINASRASHILTIEDPIEFLFIEKRSTINQREIGVDAESFASALRSALRQNPDVILVGELRDRENNGNGADGRRDWASRAFNPAHHGCHGKHYPVAVLFSTAPASFAQNHAIPDTQSHRCPSVW